MGGQTMHVFFSYKYKIKMAANNSTIQKSSTTLKVRKELFWTKHLVMEALSMCSEYEKGTWKYAFFVQ